MDERKIDRTDEEGLIDLSRLLRAARSGGCTVLLGSDSAVQEDWSAFLNRLRAGALPIAALNELSARRSGS